MIAIHRPHFAKSDVSSQFYSSSMSTGVSLGAARDTILLTHQILIDIPHNPDNPNMSHWPCYYRYCQAATMILLLHILECSTNEELSSIVELCAKSLRVLRTINLEESERDSELVRVVLARAVPPAERPVR
jgi:hypothetical protein